MEIKYTCSLGTLCQSSQLLKKNQLKKESYPFDWIHTSSEMILHCLQDDFTLFLDKSKYVCLTGNRCGHTYYHEKMFNHHNPLTNEDYAYYVRCVKRFKRLLRRPERKLFVMMMVNLDKMQDTQAMIQFNDSFSNYTKNYKLLVIYHIKHKENYHRFTSHKNIDFLELHTMSESDGVIFMDDRDNEYLNEVFMKNYRFQVKELKDSFDFKIGVIFIFFLVCFTMVGYRFYRNLQKLGPKYRFTHLA
jgi:hypothetical protein